MGLGGHVTAYSCASLEMSTPTTMLRMNPPTHVASGMLLVSVQKGSFLAYLGASPSEL